jgi:nucleoside-diphosphate-sugar epimerase
MKILITGTTGFLGSNIAERLLSLGHELFATCRSTSDFKKVLKFKKKVTWINTDIKGWEQIIKTNNIDQLIHVAWAGIGANDRNDWDLQIKNFYLSKEFFDLAKECNFKKVIAFGSQAEYGSYDLPTNELTIPKPNDAYGAVKVLACDYLRNLFNETDVEWYWVRVYSVFGRAENPEWLIPSVIFKLLKKEPILLTNCEQEYNYLHIDDFLDYFLYVVNNSKNNSGIYNLCNKYPVSLKDLLCKIAKLLDRSEEYLRFGRVPYRDKQSMFISGDNSKFIDCFSVKEKSENMLDIALMKTINNYKK